MLIETQRLIIRDLKFQDETDFVEMAADGSLNDCGFDKDCCSWIKQWFVEAKELAAKDNPNTDYLAYTIVLKDENVVVGSVGCSYYEDLHRTGITYFIGAKYRNKGYAQEAAEAYVYYFYNHYGAGMIATIRDENKSSWKVAEKIGFMLTEKKMYKDIDDEKEVLYRFYLIKIN